MYQLIRLDALMTGVPSTVWFCTSMVFGCVAEQNVQFCCGGITLNIVTSLTDTIFMKPRCPLCDDYCFVLSAQ